MKRNVTFTACLFVSAATIALALPGTKAAKPAAAKKPVAEAAAPTGYQADYAMAVREFHQGHWAAAEEHLKPLLGKSTDDAAIYGVLGYIAVRKGAFAEAIPELESAIKMAPQDLSARNNLGSAYLQTGKTDKAIAQYKYIVAHNPADPNAHLNLANALVQVQDYAGAVAEYPGGIASLPSPGSYKNFAFALEKVGRGAEAADAYRNAAVMSPTDSASWLSAGILYTRSGSHAKAIGALVKAIGLRVEDKFAAHVMLAQEYAAVKNAPAAEKQFQIATKLKPEEFAPWYNLALLQAQSGESAGAIASYRKAVDLHPNDAEALAGLGTLLEASGETVEAAQILQRATAILPHMTGVHAALGNAYRTNNIPAKAISEYKLALEDNQADNESRLALADLYVRDKSYANAALQYDAAAKLEPRNAGIQDARALAHEALGQFDIALAALQLSIRANPRNARAQNNIGVVYEKLGKKWLAISSYRRAAALDPKLAEAKANLARVTAR